MKNVNLFKPAAALFPAFFFCGIVHAQSTTVTPVQGTDGQTLPSASSILTPQVTDGLFGTSVTGTYLSPSMEEGRFSSNAVMSPSGAFIGLQSDSDKARAGRANRNTAETELSERDQLLLMRRFRNQTSAGTEEESFQQRSAQPYADVLPYEEPEQTAAPEVQPEQNVSAVQVPQQTLPQNPTQPSDDIWMRGSSRKRSPRPISQEVFSGVIGPSSAEIDPQWYTFGAPDGNPQQSLPEENVPEQAGTGEDAYIGGSLATPEELSADATTVNNPSDVLARNGRKEMRQVIQLQEKLETLLLQSPVVNPLSPIQVTLQGGTAVVTGVVPNENAKVEAGKILLGTPNIESVDNRLAVCGAME